MKRFLFIFSCILCLSCTTEKKKETPNKTSKTELKKPSWLIGKWIRTNDKPEHITYETWHSDFSGYGLTLKGKDTTFFEKMKLLVKNDTIVLEVSGVNEKPTPFKLIEQTDSSFICTSPKNEFPKYIHYWTSNEQLYAKIWNKKDEFSIDFVFKKLE